MFTSSKPIVGLDVAFNVELLNPMFGSAFGVALRLGKAPVVS